MTSLVAVLAVDQRGPASLYIMTDSRITWKGLPGAWDAGQKTFFSTKNAHIFGFCGNASFPPSVSRQLIELIDSGLIGTSQDPAIAHAEIKEAIDWALSTASEKFFDEFSLFHGIRENQFMSSKFRLWHTHYFNSTNKTYDREIEIDTSISCLARIDGSGATFIRSLKDRWAGTEHESTSRAAIWTFCEALASGGDRYTGGAPQLVGLWRKGPGRRFGMLWKGERYIAGLKVPDSSRGSGDLHWFNERFERCPDLPGAV